MNYQTEQNIAVSLEGDYYLFPDRLSFDLYANARVRREDVKPAHFGALPLADIIIFRTTKFEDFATYLGLP